MILKQQKNFNNYLGWKQTKDFIALIKDNKYALSSLSQAKFITNYIFDKITYIPNVKFFSACNNFHKILQAERWDAEIFEEAFKLNKVIMQKISN